MASEHTDGLRDGLEVNVLDDDPEIHPKKICNNCYRAITRRSSSVMIMQCHDDEGCQACNLYAQRAKGGRPKKRPRKSSTPRSPTSISSSELLKHTSSLLPQLSTMKSQRPLDPSRFMPPAPPVCLDDFVCPMCCMVVDRPVEMICGHIVCLHCISKWLHTCEHATPSCPCCPTQLRVASDLKPVTQVLKTILGGLKVRCDNDSCPAITDLANLRQHVEKCSPGHAARVFISAQPTRTTSPTALPVHSPLHPQTSPDSLSGASTPATPSLRSVMESPLDQPPSSEELRAFTHVAK